MKSRRRFLHRLDMWDGDGDYIIEQLARVEDFLLAVTTFRAACQRWPDAVITLRQGARIIEDSRRTRTATH